MFTAGLANEIYETETIVALTGGDMGSYPREPAVKCPGCQRRMAPMDRKPILFTDCLVDVTYVCEWCGTQTKRAVREQMTLAGASHAGNGDRHGVVP